VHGPPAFRRGRPDVPLLPPARPAAADQDVLRVREPAAGNERANDRRRGGELLRGPVSTVDRSGRGHESLASRSLRAGLVASSTTDSRSAGPKARSFAKRNLQGWWPAPASAGVTEFSRQSRDHRLSHDLASTSTK